MDHSNTIAWLVPSHGNPLALQAIQMRQNEPMAMNNFDQSSLTSTTTHTGPALQLSFDRRPKGQSGIVLGTDETCDIVLPKLPGISRRHCYLTFDSESRLILKDTSRNGTAVWYDHHSNGDKRNFSWVLSSGGSYGFPELVRRIVIDIQTLRFQVVVNDHSLDLNRYTANVERFLDQVARRHEPLVEPSVLSPLLEEDPRPVYLKYTLQAGHGAAEQTFLWNTSKPWEPIVRVVE